MKLKKVAIVKDGKDVGRIIPFNLNEGDSDFKISFIKNDYIRCLECFKDLKLKHD